MAFGSVGSMSHPAVAVVCAAMLLGGFIAGRVTGSGSAGTVTISETIPRSVLIPAQHVGSARDGRNRGPIDLARVRAVRRGPLLLTTITARHPWHDPLLRHGQV